MTWNDIRFCSATPSYVCVGPARPARECAAAPANNTTPVVGNGVAGGVPTATAGAIVIVLAGAGAAAAVGASRAG